jgi:hypothetical protein
MARHGVPGLGMPSPYGLFHTASCTCGSESRLGNACYMPDR